MRSIIIGMIGERKRSLRLRKATWGDILQLANFIFLAVFVLLLSGCGGGGTGTDNLQNSNFFVGNGKALLRWEAPADSTSTAILAGYKVYVATMSPIDKGNSLAIDVGNVTTYSVDGLGVGTYYFAVTAYNSAGDESVFSDEVSKTF